MWLGGHIMPMTLKSNTRQWNNTAVAGDKHQKQEMIQLTMTTSYLDAPKKCHTTQVYHHLQYVPLRPCQATGKGLQGQEAHISHDICLCGAKLLLQYRSCLQ
jgi:hypothetical protein